MQSIMLMTSIFLSVSVTAQPTNKHFWHTVETTASTNEIWSIWTDVSNWKNWDTGLKDAKMKTAFAKNAKGVITSLEGRKSKFKVVEYKEGHFYTFKTNLPLGGLYVKRSLEEKEGKIHFTHEVWFKGLTAGIFAKNFGASFREMLPKVMENIKQIAEDK